MMGERVKHVVHDGWVLRIDQLDLTTARLILARIATENADLREQLAEATRKRPTRPEP
jgi:hypothetical protein